MPGMNWWWILQMRWWWTLWMKQWWNLWAVHPKRAVFVQYVGEWMAAFGHSKILQRA